MKVKTMSNENGQSSAAVVRPRVSSCMFIYRVKWVKASAGAYVPPDPCSGGDYYKDICGEDIVTARTARTAKLVVEQVRVGAKVKRPEKICDA